MKIMFSMTLLILLNKINTFILLSSIISLLLINKFNIMSINMFNSLFMLDNYSIPLLMLSLLTLILVILSTNNIKNIFLLSLFIFISLILTFSSNKMIMFYIFFEMSLIPTFILITKSGKQPERLQASLYLLLYMLLSSLPLLIGILMIPHWPNFMLYLTFSSKLNFPLIFMLAFLTKLPMFLTHLWLPKAHVEAPLEGSMILAAILLKLGGYGLIRFTPFIFWKITKFNHFLISISLMGAVMSAINCFRQKDLKALVAYSSVSHMALLLASLLTMNLMSLSGVMIMMIAHGLTSSALFFLVDSLYTKFHSRTISIFKGLIHILPNLSFWWFIFIMINMSAPPSINIISEVMLMSSILNWNILSSLLMLLSMMLIASFSIMTFSSMNHNMNISSPFPKTMTKSYLSLLSHSTPLVFMIMKTELMFFSISLIMKQWFVVSKMQTILNLINPLLILSMSSLIFSLFLLYKSIFISISIPLFPFLSTNIYISMIMDWMSMMFMSTVLMISSLIIMFSYSYIPKPNHNQFKLMLLMFILSMILLILSNNIIILILGWDGLGITSYILVIFYQNHSSAASGTITILMNRLGDIAILISMSIMFFSLNWSFKSYFFPLIIMFLLMTSAISKSAQFPLSAWLPAAMAAPTPISALVHSSTLVTAGVFLMIRVMNFNHPLLMTILLLISSMTAIYSSLSAMWENDMKKIIAMSTLSQIAIMMFSISMGATFIAFFHLITHAFFKSSMFLCAGSMIHNHSYQDMRHMSSQFNSSPIVMSMLGLNSLALMGLPFMSGFFSKDAIIEFMIYSKLNSSLTLIMILSIMMTSIYTMRMNLLSSMPLIKSKSDLTLHNENFINTPIIFLSPISIFLGSLIMWVSNPTQMFLIPSMLKMLILISLLMGILISIIFPLSNKKFISMTEASISLWFIHFMSTQFLKNINKITNTISKLDNSWQEIYGPLSTNNQNFMMSSKINTTLLNFLIILLLLLITPMMIYM